MRQSDEQIKRNLDEQSVLKQKIAAGSKREAGNLSVRDYTDELYA